MSRRLLPFAAVAVFAFAGCTMIPHYERPASPVSTRFPGGPDQSGDAADIRWRDFFADPRLKRIVELMLANNRDLRVAALNVAYHQTEYRIARSELFHTVDATGSYTRAGRRATPRAGARRVAMVPPPAPTA